MNLSSRNRFILYTTCGYLVFGSAWIFLSDRMLMAFTDISDITRLSTTKGIAFIILTALLLVLALFAVPDRKTTESKGGYRSSEFLTLADQLPRWIAYIFAVAVTLAMLLVRMHIAVSFGQRPLLILFMLPIILSSVLGGFGPGLIATAIASLGIDYYAIPPLHSLRIGQPHDLFQWFMLISSGILSSFLSELLHRARRQSEERRMLQEVAQEALRESEKKFRLITENTADIISILDMNLRFTYFSPAVKLLRGFTVEEAMEQPLVQTLTPESFQIALDVFEKERLLEASGTADPDRTRILELEEYKKDGSTIWMELSLSFLRDKNKKPTEIIIVARDINKRKQSEEALRQSELRFRTVSRLSSDFAYSCSHTGDGGYAVDWITDTFYALTGISESELNNLRCWMALAHPEDSDMAAEPLQRLRPGESDTRDFRIVAKDGRILTVTNHMECESDPAEPGGLRVYGSVQNITERKRAEDALKESEVKYRSMMQAMDDAVYICSGDFRIEYMNTAMIKRLGYDATGDICHKTMHGLDESCPWCVHEKVMSGQSIKAEVVSLKDNRTYHVSNSPIFHSHGAVSKLTILRDITETKKTEERLLQAQKMEAIGSLAGGIAHDLNNILFPISGFSEMLLDEIPSDSHVHENIEQIYKSAKRGSDLVNQILAFSRQSNLQKLPIRIQPILKEVLKLVRATIPKNIEFTSHIAKDCGRVSADPTQIHQIAMNLITNAYHAVGEKSGTINLELKETVCEKDDLHDITMKSGKYACITISDNGAGIDQSLLDKIFEPYFTTKEVGKGTGLGLSVVHGIVKEHGGEIRVSSEVAKGTTFDVYLPLLEEAMDSMAAAAARTYPTGAESILLVDDEEPIAQMVKMMLEKLGYRITVRTSSPDALAAFNVNPTKFDLVISDRGMPNMTGEQLARELILIRPDIPIIICTGFSDENDEQRARDLGVKGFLKKPVARGDLAEMVRKVLDESKRSTFG